MVSSFRLTSVFRHLFSVLSQCIYNMYTIASMVFLILSMLAGTGAGIVYPAPEANGMPLLIPINHDRQPPDAHFHTERNIIYIVFL